MDATLRDRLVLMEQQFLIAIVSQDEAALEDFYQKWSWLFRHLQAVGACGNLDDSIILLLSRMSQAIRATTKCMMDCEDILNDAQTYTLSCPDLDLPSDYLPSVSANPSTLTRCHLLFPSPGTAGILGRNKLLDACAYRWLVQNMHNPYPASSQLQVIGEKSMTSVEQAELWFEEARDSIGWTKLSREFFMGSVDATIAAARRFYLERDKTIPFSIAFAFSEAKAFMETLFLEHPASPMGQVWYTTQALRSMPIDDKLAHFNDLSDEEIEEDTTPPPSVAGCKRNFPEDKATSLDPNLLRPLKRLRTQSLQQVHLHSESLYSLSNTSTKSAAEALTDTSTIPVSFVQPTDSCFPVGSKLSPDSLPLNSTGQMQTDLHGSASEMVAVTSDLRASQDEMRNQQIPKGSPQAPSERQLNPSTNHTQDLSPGSVPTVMWPISPPLDHHPTDSTGASQITADPGIPVDLSVFDWNSIPNPLLETTILMNQPASIYVPSSDLTPLNFGLPNPLYTEQLTEKACNPPYPLDDLGSLEDFSLLQFPIPTTIPPDISSSPVSFCSDNSTFASPEMDWSAITDFINEFTSFSAESSSAPSPSSTFDAAPSTPENPTSSLLLSPPHEVNKPISLLDPSIPPSAFLPAEPGIFTDDASSMWSLLCGLS